MAVAKPSSTKSVAIVLPTARPGRNSPKVAKLILDSIKGKIPRDVSVKVIDLAEWKLPVWADDAIPMTVTSSEKYTAKITQRWSREIASQDGFIFLVPEYNGSYAGSLKNAMDFVYNEWVGKAAMLVSYGARPAEQLHGGKHLLDALTINQMKVVSTVLTLSISTMDREKTASGSDLVFYKKEVEEQHRQELITAWDGLLKNLAGSEKSSPASA